MENDENLCKNAQNAKGSSSKIEKSRKNIISDKPKLNIVIDIIMFLLMMLIAGIGFLMKYVLVAGFKRNIDYGVNIDLQFLGLTRHQWGDIHLILSISFLILLIIHIILHWKFILCTFQRMIPTKGKRITIVAIITVLSLLLISFPLFIRPEKVSHEPNYKNKNHKSYNLDSNHSKSQDSTDIVDILTHTDKNKLKNNSEKHNMEFKEYEVLGYQTLQFIADKYNIPASVIAKDLNLPSTVADEKLGSLKKQYNFTMNDVKKSIHNYKNR